MEEKKTRIDSWNPDRGFGFATVDGRKVFVHAKVFSSRGGERGNLIGKGDDLTDLEVTDLIVDWKASRGPKALRARLTENSAQRLLQRDFLASARWRLAKYLSWAAWREGHPGGASGPGTRGHVSRAIALARAVPEEVLSSDLVFVDSSSRTEPHAGTRLAVWAEEHITTLAEKSRQEILPLSCQCERCQKRWQEATEKIPFSLTPGENVNDARQTWRRRVWESLGAVASGDVDSQWNEK